MAETLSCRFALEWALDEVWEQIIAESDCQYVVRAINAHAIYSSQLGLILQDCLDLLLQFQVCFVVHVNRTTNKVVTLSLELRPHHPSLENGRIVLLLSLGICFCKIYMDKFLTLSKKNSI